jgi:predicted nucleotidyltransferase
MSEKEQILNVLKALKPEMTTRFKVREIALFGSFVRGEQGTASDIDLVVELEEGADLFDLVALGQFLEERLGRKVDLGTKRSLRKEIRDQVFKEMAAI